jgi:hypothetical protein
VVLAAVLTVYWYGHYCSLSQYHDQAAAAIM